MGRALIFVEMKNFLDFRLNLFDLSESNLHFLSHLIDNFIMKIKSGKFVDLIDKLLYNDLFLF